VQGGDYQALVKIHKGSIRVAYDALKKHADEHGCDTSMRHFKLNK